MPDYAVKGKEQHKLGLFACLSMALRFIWFNHRKAQLQTSKRPLLWMGVRQHMHGGRPSLRCWTRSVFCVDFQRKCRPRQWVGNVTVRWKPSWDTRCQLALSSLHPNSFYSHSLQKSTGSCAWKYHKGSKVSRWHFCSFLCTPNGTSFPCVPTENGNSLGNRRPLNKWEKIRF